jgi:predicted MFS family arabinose efflux permease
MLTSRWLMLAVLFVARLALGYQFQSTGSLAPFLVRDLALDYAQVATLIGMFILPGLVTAIPSGLLTQRFGDKTVVSCGMALMIMGSVLESLSASYSSILLGRGLSGMGGAILTVIMSKMVIDWFIDGELFVGLAVFIVGWPVGIAAAQTTQSRLAETFSWQLAFMFSAALVTLALVLMVAFYRSPVSTNAGAAQRGGLTGWEMGTVSLAGIVWMLFNASYFVVVSFGSAQLVEQGMAVTDAESIVSIVSWEFIFALPLGGYLATRLDVANPILFGALTVSMVAAATIPFSASSILPFVIFGLALALSAPVIIALPAEILGARARGRGLAFYYVWYFAGTPALISCGEFFNRQAGSTSASLLFAAVMIGCSLVFASAFRICQLAKFHQLRADRAARLGLSSQSDLSGRFM